MQLTPSDPLRDSETSNQPLEVPTGLLPVLGAAALSACGGGGNPAGGAVLGADAQPISSRLGQASTGAAPTQAQAAAFLAQAGFGGNMADVDEVVALGYEGWINRQMTMPVTRGFVQWMVEWGIDDMYFGLWMGAMWQAFATYPEQLRLRTAYAFSQILVLSFRHLSTAGEHHMVAGYLDVLSKHAFGNFRSLLEDVTLNPGMGQFLNMRGNRKADGVRIPDENYAREIMQLFTIGLEKLNPDGTPVLDSKGHVVPTYGEADVQGLAAVFTGWDYSEATDPAGQRSPMAYSRAVPMQHFPDRHSTTEKRFLGVTIPAGTNGPTSLRIALDTLFNHPNTGPFIALRLIQRLVTSNPVPAYVKRVADVFANNGGGVRGDLAAVVRAILLDPEARGKSVQPPEHRGKLREPVLRFLQFCRIFSVTSGTHPDAGYRNRWDHGSTEHDTQLGQMPMNAPSVFNFYTYDFKPLNTDLSRAGLVAPELNLAAEPNVVGYLNFMNRVINGETDFQPKINSFEGVAPDATALVSQLSMLFTGSTLQTSTVNLIAQAVGTMPSEHYLEKFARIKAATLLIMASPEYLVQRT